MARKHKDDNVKEGKEDEDDTFDYPFKAKEYFKRTEAKRRKWRPVKQILADPRSAPFLSMRAPPSLNTGKQKWCDVTGLVAKYHDPKTGLHYHSSACFNHIRALSPAAVQLLLSLRRANTEI